MVSGEGKGGIRTRIAMDSPVCFVAETTEDGGKVDNVDRTRVSDDGKVVEEFALDTEGEEPEGADKIFEMESHSLYRFDRDAGGCVCELIEEAGCPVSQTRAEEGTLYVTFYAEDMKNVRDIIGRLKDEYGDVYIKEMVRTGDDHVDNPVLFDRGVLTDRQMEVLVEGYRMGYFDHGEGANATEVADELGISLSTLSEHLSLAQNKILESLIDR